MEFPIPLPRRVPSETRTPSPLREYRKETVVVTPVATSPPSSRYRGPLPHYHLSVPVTPSRHPTRRPLVPPFQSDYRPPTPLVSLTYESKKGVALITTTRWTGVWTTDVYPKLNRTPLDPRNQQRLSRDGVVRGR